MAFDKQALAGPISEKLWKLFGPQKTMRLKLVVIKEWKFCLYYEYVKKTAL